MSFLDRFAAVRPFDTRLYWPFRVGNAEVGLIEKPLARRLRRFSDVFRVAGGAVALAPELRGFRARTEAVETVLRALHAEGLFPGWRNEPYPVAPSFAAPPLLVMERAAVPRFGVRSYGVHVNGYVRDGNTLKLWVARRSPDKPTDPGKLDHLVAGGVAAGLTLRETLVKECAEEADIAPGLAAAAHGVGTISYETERPEGLRRNVVFIYDLQLPTDFVPRNTDGEVASFDLWPIERVIGTVREGDDYKFNCALVVIDFLIRHGIIEPDHPDYAEICRNLRRG